MWLEFFCGLLFFRYFRRFFHNDDEDIDSSDSTAIFHVATRIEKIYGGKVYVGLRIPDADSGSRQNIDMVLVTKGLAMVVCVRNFSGFVDVDKDGSWVCIGEKRHKKERHPDPVEESKRQVAILESYLERRGVTLPESYLIGRVVLPNPNCRTANSINCLEEVISFDKWTELKREPKSEFSNWFKDAFHGGKKDMQEEILLTIQFILRTAPMWDRLKLKGDRNILGEFVEFKGKQEDMQALRCVERSKVSQLIIQKSSLFGCLGISDVQVLYAPRNYRSEGASASEWKETTVKSGTEIVFQPLNSKKTRKIKLSSVVSASLSA